VSKYSLLQGEEKRCYICGSERMLERHHIYGGAYRKWSEAYGCWVYLCKHHHTGDMYGNKDSVHFNGLMSLALKQKCQRAFEENHTRKEFMHIFGRNWL